MELKKEHIVSVFKQFNHQGKFESFSELTSGHINDTFLIKTKSEQNFVLQRINNFVFKKAKQLILNKASVSDYIQLKLTDLTSEELNERVLRFIYTPEGLPYYEDKDGGFWNLSYYIEGSKTYERVESEEIAYEGGKLFGDFLNLTKGFPICEIEEILPNFHEMSFRFQQFNEALLAANEERKKLAASCIKQAMQLKEEMHILQDLKNSGKIPLRVTHNDTKISNALFDKNNKGLCVIDTDTVMIGIIHYDYGDAVRTFCATANEDEADLSLINFNLKFFEAFTKGFLEKIYNQCSELDVKCFPLAAKTITFIMGLRMLTDFLNNDVYYKTSYNLHNLVRAKNQFKMVKNIDENFKKMNNIAMSQFKKLKNEN